MSVEYLGSKFRTCVSPAVHSCLCCEHSDLELTRALHFRRFSSKSPKVLAFRQLLHVFQSRVSSKRDMCLCAGEMASVNGIYKQ